MKKLLIVFVFAVMATLFSLAGDAKYIFYFIGDGMGANQVLAAEMYLAELEGRIGRNQLAMTSLPVSSQASTFSDSNGITDSSAAGTCLATGVKTTNHTLGLDPEGKSLTTIAEILKARGWGVGITTSVSIDHATPASFYAHVEKRNEYYKIGRQLAASDFDFFGGATFYQPHDPKDSATTSLYQLLRDNHYTVARGYQDYLGKRANAKKMVLIQEHEGLSDDYKGKGLIPYSLDKKAGDLTLPQITSAAIDFLSSHNDRFFLMVEGGAIDWACHSNDAATVIGEVLEFDESLRVALDFYYQHPDETLILVTADHETGGLGLGNSDYTLNLQILKNQQVSVAQLSDKLREQYENNGNKLKWKQVRQLLREDLNFFDEVEITAKEEKELRQALKLTNHNKGSVKTLYKQLSKLADTAVRILNRKSKLGWTTGAHSASAVPVFAIGVGAEEFTGWKDNSELMPILLKNAATDASK